MTTANNPSAIELLEQGKKKLEAVNARRTRVQVQIESARDRLAQVKQEALQNFGTMDLAELKALLRKHEAENAEALPFFLSSVEQFDEKVTKLSKALADPQALAELLAAMPDPIAEAPVAAQATAEFDSEDI